MVTRLRNTQHDRHVPVSVCAARCNGVALILGLLVSTSPLYLQASTHSLSFSNRTALIAAGAHVLSITDSPIKFSKDLSFPSQTNYWSDLSSEVACSSTTEIYELWAKRYGYCSDVNGTFALPTEVEAMHRLSQAVVVLLSFSVLSILCTDWMTVPGTMASAFFTALSCFVTAALIYLISFSQWNRDLLSEKGGPIPLRDVDGEFRVITGPFLYGPAFAAVILVFMISLFSSIVLLQAAFWLRNDFRLESEVLDLEECPKSQRTDLPQDEAQVTAA